MPEVVGFGSPEIIQPPEEYERWRRKWTAAIYELMIERVPKRDFEKHVAGWINRCRAEGGVPRFQAFYAGRPLKYEDRPALLATCYGAAERVPRVLLTNVPEDDWSVAVLFVNDWEYFLWKYGGGKERGEPPPPLYRSRRRR